MSEIKKLAGQTAVYGLSSIIPRFISYLLFPIHIAIFSPEKYGIITELYAYITFLVIILTYGMETAFFRFSNQQNDPKKVYSTTFITILLSSIIFFLIVYFFKNNIATALMYPNNSEYIVYFAAILSIDAITSIPFAKLRKEEKALKFAFIKITSVIINFLLNIFFLIYCKNHYQNNQFIDFIYNDQIGVGYVFIANLLSSLYTLILLSPEYFKINFKIDIKILKTMLIYALPLLIAGMAGNINEALDRVLFKHLIKDNSAMFQLGVYGANIKFAVLMTLFIQMFRYAFEPFYFNHAEKSDSKKMFADITLYFIIFGLCIFLFVMLYIDIFQVVMYNSAYRTGLKIVPILLMANLFLGIFYNLSLWYKVSNKTLYGAYLTIIGSLITIAINIIFVPYYGYLAAAWAHLVCYLVITVISWYWGKKHYDVPYNIKKIALYILIALIIFTITKYLTISNLYLKLVVNTLFLIAFITYIEYKERILSKILRK